MSGVVLCRLPENAALVGRVPYPFLIDGRWFEEDASDGGIESKLFHGLGGGGTVDFRRRGQSCIVCLVAGLGIAMRQSFGISLEQVPCLEKGAGHAERVS